MGPYDPSQTVVIPNQTTKKFTKVAILGISCSMNPLSLSVVYPLPCKPIPKNFDIACQELKK